MVLHLFHVMMAEPTSSSFISESYFEIELVKKLEVVIEKQRNEIKKLDQSVIDYKTENEEVTCSE